MRVLIISADRGFFQETRALLQNTSESFTVEYSADPGSVDRIPSLQADLSLIDLDSIPSAADSLPKICEQHPQINIIVVTARSHDPAALDALRNGARGHLSKDREGQAQIVAALGAVHHGESFLGPAMAGVILDEINYQYHLVRSAQA